MNRRGAALRRRYGRAQLCPTSPRAINMLDQTWGRLKVVAYAGPSKGGTAWWCVCKCGNRTKVRGYQLRTGHTVSCGCYARENTIARSTTHGGCQYPEYNVWACMLDRCQRKTNTYYKNYGGRGIVVCNRWQKFDHFLADMGSRPSAAHTLERMDNDKGYSPKNCCWATRQEQGLNTRRTRWVVLGAKRLPAKLAAQLLGIPYKLFHRRLSWGWPVERAALAVDPRARWLRLPNGKRVRLSNAAREAGLRASTVHGRLSRGQSVKQALNMETV